MISYLIEASLCLVLFYLFYWIFLSREKLLSINRFFLLGALLLSATMPLLNISFGSLPTDAVSNWQEITLSPAVSEATVAPAPTGPNTLLLVYWSGFTLTVLILLFRLLNVFRSIGNTKSELLHGVKVTRIRGKRAFSFFNSIFIPDSLQDETYTESILMHEQAHSKGLHSLDLIFVEILKALFWFNPAIYAYYKSLKIQHEYIADMQAMNDQPDVYQDALIRHSLEIQGFPLSSAFTQPPIEKRIQMIQKLKASPMKKIKVVFALPLLILLFITVSCAEKALPERNTEPSVEDVENSVSELKGALESQMVQETPKEWSKVVDPSSIRGWLKDAKTNAPILNAKIWSLPSGKSTSSNEEGFYNLPSTPKDTLISFTAAGYKSMDVPRKNFSIINVVLESK